MILGAVLGSILLLIVLIVVGAVIVVRRRRRRRSESESENTVPQTVKEIPASIESVRKYVYFYYVSSATMVRHIQYLIF